MKIESPSSITSHEVSVRLEWISTRILPGVAVLILSIPISQWADSNFPDGIVPVSIIFLMIVIILWSMYMAVQYAFVGIVQTRKGKDSYGKTSKEDNNLPEKDKQKPILLLEAKSIVAESNPTEEVCDTVVVGEIAEEVSVTDNKIVSEEANHANESSTVSATPSCSTYQ